MLRFTVGMYEECDKNKHEIKMLTHLSCAVHYIIDGEGWFNGKKIGKGMGFTTYRNDLVSYRPDRENPWTYVWFRLEGEDSEDVLLNSGIPKKSDTFVVNNVNRIQKVALSLFGKGVEYAPENKLESEALAKLMLSLNCMERTDETDYAQKARTFIDSNFHKRISVEDVASHVSVERKYLRMLFVKRYGVSTMDYIMKKRMERAKELLAQTNAPISAVASSVGYDDALGFSRIFKKYVGLSPKDYRNKNS